MEKGENSHFLYGNRTWNIVFRVGHCVTRKILTNWRVQRRATKMIPRLEGLVYKEGLKELNTSVALQRDD